MRNQVTVHRVVKNVKRTRQYIQPHFHPFFHYIYSLSGHTRVTVGEQVYETAQGCLMLIPPGMLHSIVSVDTSCCLDIKFSCSEELEQSISQLPCYIHLLDSRCSSLIRNIFEEAVGQEQNFDEMIHIRMYELLLLLLRRQNTNSQIWNQADFTASGEDNHNIRKALQYIEEDLEKPIRITELAEKCGYSDNYFRQIFRECTGMSPNTYINQRKIAKSRELMLYSQLNITQISELLGYQSIHYFSRLFKKVTGITPTEYIDRTKVNRPINVIHNTNTPMQEYEIPIQDTVSASPLGTGMEKNPAL